MRWICFTILWTAGCSDPGGRAGRSPTTAPGATVGAEIDATAVDTSLSETAPAIDTTPPETAPANDASPPETATDEGCACRVAGACVAEGEREPGNLCRVCRAATDRHGWSDDDGAKCSDGDPCTSGERCLHGSCGGGLAVTSGACAPPEELPCETHFDCYPAQVCARWRTDGVLRCSVPCGAKSECDEDFVCAKLPGSAQVGFCEPQPANKLLDGSPCMDDAACASGRCHAGLCRASCFDDMACDGATCQLDDDALARARGTASSACVADPPGLPLGSICTADRGQSYGGSACGSKHCDLMRYPATLALPCAPLCRREADCGPAQECSLVWYADVPHPSALAFHPQLRAPTHDAVSACFTSTAGAGWLEDGAPCTSPEACKSDKCLHLLPQDTQRYCTSFCATDADCPANMACKLDSLTLASPWFQSPTITAQPPRTDARTLVRVCKFE